MDYPKSLPDVYLHDGKFTDGTPDGTIPPSRDPASTMNDVIDSIIAVQTAGGLAADEGNVTQLRDAILALIAANGFSIPAQPDHVGAAADADELAIVVGGTHKRINVAELFEGRATVDQRARDQIALTNHRLLISTAISSEALVQGKQWELTTNEWGATSTGETYVAGSPGYYASAIAASVAYVYTGADQTLEIPDGVTALTVKLWGANGGDNGASLGGRGGFAGGVLAVTPGETLTLIVGGKGANSPSTSQAYGGGGAGGGGTNGCGGGGRTAIRRGGTEIITAGAGGGTHTARASYGGAGGDTTGSPGYPVGTGGGGGGTQSAGGDAGSGSGTNGNPGSQWQGGAAYAPDAGGGGGGYYGGGGGANGCGGGGGSSYVANAAITGGTTAAGSGANRGNAADADFVDNGGQGRIVVSYSLAQDTTLMPPAPITLAASPPYGDLYFLYRDDSGAAVLGVDVTVDLSRDGGTTWTAATLTSLAAYDGTYSEVRARANLSGQPAGTALTCRIKTHNTKAQRVAAPALYGE